MTEAMTKKDIPTKGAILQRDRETYAIAPHIPGGFTDTATLRKICDVADKYNLALKITSAQRIAMIGAKEEELDAIWSDLAQNPGAAIGLCVRSVKVCPGTQHCKRAVLDSASLGLKLDRIYHAMELPNKMKMGVSGCLLSCSESGVKDIGIVGHNKGWRIFVGGNAGPRPRLGEMLVDNVQSEEEVLEIVAKVVDFYKNDPQQGRIGKLVEEMGIEAFRAKVLGTAAAAAGSAK
ncbi:MULTISPECIES: nitrite/sulfite reductase domain-containing protein [Citrifermentans]|uniref:Sulfite reductase, assimilatory n=1 Tax=Citrifermentans bemidjiense (strain ATCC BAA-1014 / DSM 16622 / JCM 12645 / Bem) TaxID=404380 RepID=B5ED56_CITBB|nr:MULTISPECIES: NAD(P)/FAD-dependent oxidoreductase [Citrifermentans]ACH37642.1 sulfite reductase, assimilatory [Citrifermentans bemidjiense Bem]